MNTCKIKIVVLFFISLSPLISFAMAQVCMNQPLIGKYILNPVSCSPNGPGEPPQELTSFSVTAVAGKPDTVQFNFEGWETSWEIPHLFPDGNNEYTCSEKNGVTKVSHFDDNNRPGNYTDVDFLVSEGRGSVWRTYDDQTWGCIWRFQKENP